MGCHSVERPLVELLPMGTALIVTFAATTDLIGDARTERIGSFDDYQACALAGRTLYSQQHWECVPENQHPKEAPAAR